MFCGRQRRLRCVLLSVMSLCRLLQQGKALCDFWFHPYMYLDSRLLHWIFLTHRYWLKNSSFKGIDDFSRCQNILKHGFESVYLCKKFKWKCSPPKEQPSKCKSPSEVQRGTSTGSVLRLGLDVSPRCSLYWAQHRETERGMEMGGD